MFGYSTVALLATVSVIVADNQLPKCTFGNYDIIPKDDCTGYFLCVYGKPVEMPPCPAGSVFSSGAHVCVPKGSIYDDCRKQGASTGGNIGLPDTMPVLPDLGPLSPQEQCAVHGGIFPHPTECQAYYNCSMVYQSVPMLLEQHMMECQYPELFNAETNRCDHFENVKCGPRTEFKDGCNYRRNQCPVSHCIPCHVRLPSCDGKRDGFNAHEGKPWSPYYAVCFKERTVSEETCKPDVNGQPQLFHPGLSACVPLDMIPQEHGGMMPDCSNKRDGLYPDDFGRCNQYVKCESGRYVNKFKCPFGEVFDTLHSMCVEEQKACGLCGQNPTC